MSDPSTPDGPSHAPREDARASNPTRTSAPHASAPPPSAPLSAPVSSQSLELSLTLPLLRVLRPVAAFALLALLVGRAVGPALRGVSTGLSRIVVYTGIAADVVSQVFAFVGTMLAVLAVFAAARSRLPLAARFGAITLGGFAILPTLWAVHQAVPDLSAALVGTSAAVLALLAVPAALRAPYARGPAVVLVLVALGGILRLASVGLAFQAAVQGWARLAPLSQALATAGFLADAFAVGAAVGWAGGQTRGAAVPGASVQVGPPPPPRRLTSPVSIAVFAVALLCTRQALAGADDLRPVDVFLWRVATRLTTRPDPSVPLSFQVFIAFLSPLVAGWAVLARGALAPLGAAVALALCAHGAVEMPPSALMLIAGSLGLALTAHEGRGLWMLMTDPDRRA